MRKTLTIISALAILILGVFLLTGCEEKKEENNTKEPLTVGGKVGGWETMFANKQVNMDEETLKIFENAKKDYTSLELDAVALLGQQVVAGTNRMFLAKGYQKGEESKATYRIVIVYTDLQNKSTITKVEDFDYSKYTHVNIERNAEVLLGGWSTDLPTKGAELEPEVQAVFDGATSTLTGMTYYPITTLGKQIVAGTNYAVICYGGASYQNAIGSIYVLTIYKDLTGNQEIVSQAYVNLADFNK